MYPTCYLHNTKTDRYHPISFRLAPLPGGVVAPTRWKSLGHHTEGFDTFDEAQAWVASGTDQGLVDKGEVYEWDGEEVPAKVAFFPLAS